MNCHLCKNTIKKPKYYLAEDKPICHVCKREIAAFRPNEKIVIKE